jgi:hypothetical protein
MGFTVDEQQLADFGGYLGAEAAETLPVIETLARDEGLSDDGFMGLLSELGDIVNGPISVKVGAAFSLMQTKMCDLGDSVIATARDYGYRDADNRKLMERVGLDGNTDEDVDFGTGGETYTGDPSTGNQYAQVEYSKFHTTPLSPADIQRDGTDYSETLDYTFELHALDYVWSKFGHLFGVEGGKGFVDTIVEPLAGNYNSILANGEAWQEVGKQFGELADNLVKNLGTLAREHWKGDASAALTQFVEVFWARGAAAAGATIGDFIYLGFEKISTISLKIAQLAVDIIKIIIKAAKRIATRAIPVVGWVWAAGEYVGEFVGIEVDVTHEAVQEIIETAKIVFKLYGHIETIVSTMRDYFTTVQELYATVKAIPEIGSLRDASDTYDSINDSRQQLQEQQDTLKSETTAARQDIKELNQIGKDADADAATANK